MGLQSHAFAPVENLQRYELEHRPIRRWSEVRVASDDDIPGIIDLTAIYLPNISVDPAAIYAVHRKSRSILSVRGPKGLIGATAFLPLNAKGFDVLKTGRFPIANPDVSLLTGPGEQASAIYSWALCVPGSAVAAMGQVMEWVRQPSYAGCDIYACPGTPAGARFMAKIGFTTTPSLTLNDVPLWIYRRPVVPVPAVKR